MITISLLIIVSLFFNGCGQCTPEINTVYVESRVPKLKTLYHVEPYELGDVKEFDDTHYIIPKSDLEQASDVSKKRIRIINFYEKQNLKYNKDFSTN